MVGKKVQIIAGTCENYIIGYTLDVQKNGEVKFERVFAERAHTQSVRKLSVSGKFLASGGADELIKIYNLKRNVEIGCLEKHTGNITGLAFHKNTYLFSASEDGVICIYKADSWRCEKTLSAHPGGVTSISIHPSGKLALSVGKDKKLCTWNLIKGKKAYITNLKTVADIVQWNPTGEQFVVVKKSCLDIYEVSTGQVKYSVDFKETIQCVVFITDNIVAVGGEGKNICLYDVTNLIELTQWPAHNMRIKSLRKIPTHSLDEVWLVSASTDGIIKIWSIELLSVTGTPKLLGKVDTTCRIICMDIYGTLQNASIKQEVRAGEEVKEVEGLEDDDDEKGLAEENEDLDEEDLDSETSFKEEEEEDLEDEDSVEEEEEEEEGDNDDDNDDDDSDSYDVFLNEVDDSEVEETMEIKEDPDASESSEEETRLVGLQKKRKNGTAKRAKEFEKSKKKSGKKNIHSHDENNATGKGNRPKLGKSTEQDTILTQTGNKPTMKGKTNTKTGKKGENGTTQGEKGQKRKNSNQTAKNIHNAPNKKSKKMKVK